MKPQKNAPGIQVVCPHCGCYFYGGVAFWVMPTVEAQYNRIQKPERHLQHQRATWVLLHDAPIGAPEKSIADRAAELQAFHSDAEDCRIVAEAEHAGVPALVTFDRTLIEHLTPRTRLALRRPSEFFASLGIEAGAEPVLTPHPSDPLAAARWWRF